MDKQDEIKLLCSRLIEERARRIQEHDDANPDVGMGKSWNSCVAEAMQELGFTKDNLNL